MVGSNDRKNSGMPDHTPHVVFRYNFRSADDWDEIPVDMDFVPRVGDVVMLAGRDYTVTRVAYDLPHEGAMKPALWVFVDAQ